jgi:lysine 2-monooxygenase
MASYNDSTNTDFWASFESTTTFNGVPPPADDDGLRLPDDVVTTVSMVQEGNRQLRELHGAGVDLPDPHTAMFFDWSRDPFGGRSHYWNIGARSWEVAPRIRQPLPDANVYIAGQAWSSNQGWIEEALNNTEGLLEQKFELSRPVWLPPDHFLGP